MCEIDCFVKYGNLYIGNQSVTENGLDCVDWNGEYGLNGTMCRNPTNEESPWCYVSEDHTLRDFCDNECPEGEEYNPYLQAAVSTLSTGPVGIGDREIHLNKDLILRSCRADGRLLKPSKPLTVIDRYFLSDDQLDIWTSDVTISEQTYGIIFLVDIEENLIFKSSELNLNNALSTNFLQWQNYPTTSFSYTLVDVGSDVNIPSCSGFMTFCLHYTSPVLSVGGTELAILGERSKWTPIAMDRISNIDIQSSTVIVDVIGSSGEEVIISFWSNVDDIFDITCLFTADGVASIDTDRKVCVTM